MIESRINPTKIVDEYLNHGENSKENANLSHNPSGLLLSVGTEGLKKDYLSRLKETGFENLVNWHKEGKVHIHDLGLGFNVPYCAGHSLLNLLCDGITTDSVKSSPAKHFSSVINHMVNYIGDNANSFAGAQAFNDVDLYLSAYAYKTYLDHKKMGCSPNIAFQLTRKIVYQEIQAFIFHMNYNTRWGGQAPFSNITLSITVPDDMKDQLALVGGKPIKEYYNFMQDGIEVKNQTYGDLIEWQQLVVDAFLDTFIAGDAEGKSFTFPVLTINVTDNFFESKNCDKICELANKFGTPFFQNYINGISGLKKARPEDSRSMCCRLSISLEDLQAHTGGLFGNGDNTGSLQVVTVSLPYVAQETKTWYSQKLVKMNKEVLLTYFLKEIDNIMEEIKNEQLWKREIINEYYELGYFQLAKQNFKKGFNTFFTTIGFIGLWEAVEIIIDNDKSFLTDDGMLIAEKILLHMKNNCDKFMKETGKLFNLESTPAESASYKLAKKALKQYPDIKFRGKKKTAYFTNSCWIPVEYQDDLSLIFETQNKLQIIPSGGTVLHFTTGEDLSTEQVKETIKTICQTKIPYFSINSIFSVCPICGYNKGANEICPNKHSNEDILELYKKDPSKVIF